MGNSEPNQMMIYFIVSICLKEFSVLIEISFFFDMWPFNWINIWNTYLKFEWWLILVTSFKLYLNWTLTIHPVMQSILWNKPSEWRKLMIDTFIKSYFNTLGMVFPGFWPRFGVCHPFGLRKMAIEL